MRRFFCCFLTLVALLGVSGCDAKGKATINEDGVATIDMLATFEKAIVKEQKLTCERVAHDIVSDNIDLEGVKIETQDSNGDLTCRFSGKVVPGDDIDIDTSKDKVTLVTGQSEKTYIPYLAPSKFTLTLSMPYTIQTASAGTVNGHSVTFNSVGELNDLVVVASPKATPGETDTGKINEDPGYRSVIERNLVLIAVGATIVIVLGLFGVVKLLHKRQK